MSENAKWYVIHTYSGYENKVATSIQKTVENRNLQEWIHATHIPMETVVEIKDGERREVERMVFPGYVLVKMVMTDESWYIIRNVRGVTGFVGPSNGEDKKPLPLPDHEVEKLGVEKHEISVSYGVGDKVKILGGMLKDFVGTVKEVDIENGEVVINVTIMNRETPTTCDLEDVALVEE
ncbi:MAG: transcription termination/antitermination factor NusG [Clostridia bacterium]|nr:transcription termination/antitermination factor NusG [Clostridia bacterium]